MHLLKEYTSQLKLYNFPVIVRINYSLDDMPRYPNDFDYGSEVENAAELLKFQRGEASSISILVVASVPQLSAHVTGIDSLGSCFVDNKTLESDIMDHVQSHSMVLNAVDELETELKEMIEKLKLNNKGFSI